MDQQSNKINRKSLELFLQKLELADKYNIMLEQYPTDSQTAATMLFEAFMDGNIYNKNTVDLGTGNGILAIGSKYLGAISSTAVDIDKNMAAIANKNAMNAGMEINVLNEDIKEVSGEYDTVLMNPPFGSIIKHDDLSFIDRAIAIGKNIYAIHNMKSREFIINYYSSRSTIIRETKIFVNIPHLYAHHKNVHYDIEALLIYARTF
ncbi:MAG: METTL5 family protein [Ferroplasma sp.]